MFKRIVSAGVACAVLITSIMVNNINSYAQNGYPSSGDIAPAVDDAIIMTEAWESVGFTSEEIMNLLKLERKGEEFTQSINNEVENLKAECENEFVERIKNDFSTSSKATRATNGNPPQSEDEQRDRFLHVYNDMITNYANETNNGYYIVYLYLSHYVDNPGYSKENPNFNRIYADKLITEDIKAYNTFIKGTKWTTIGDDAVTLANGVYTLNETATDIESLVKDGKNTALNTIKLINDLDGFELDEWYDSANRIIVSKFLENYAAAKTAQDIIDAINNDLDTTSDIQSDYINICVTGLIGMIEGTVPLVGSILALSTFTYDFYATLINRARLATLQSSYNYRVTLRIYG